MIIIGGYIDFESADDIAAVKAAGRDMVAKTLKEDGCVDYCFAVDIANPTRIRLFEKWRDQDALNAHMQSAHMATFMQSLMSAKRTGADVCSYTASDEAKLI